MYLPNISNSFNGETLTLTSCYTDFILPYRDDVLIFYKKHRFSFYRMFTNSSYLTIDGMNEETCGDMSLYNGAGIWVKSFKNIILRDFQIILHKMSKHNNVIVNNEGYLYVLNLDNNTWKHLYDITFEQLFHERIELPEKKKARFLADNLWKLGFTDYNDNLIQKDL